MVAKITISDIISSSEKYRHQHISLSGTINDYSTSGKHSGRNVYLRLVDGSCNSSLLIIFIASDRTQLWSKNRN